MSILIQCACFWTLQNRIIGTQVQHYDSLPGECNGARESRTYPETQPWTFNIRMLEIQTHKHIISLRRNIIRNIQILQIDQLLWYDSTGLLLFCIASCNYLVFGFNSFEMKFKLLWFHATAHTNSNSAIKLVRLIVLFTRQKGETGQRKTKRERKRQQNKNCEIFR